MQVLFWEVTRRERFCILTVKHRGNAVWGAGADGAVDAGCGELFEVLVTVRAHFCDIDARVLPGMQVTVRAHVCILTVGCKGACSLGGGLGFCAG